MRTTKVEPLVPGFGTNSKPTPAPAFGGESELFRVQITDEDRREAERAFRYYDRNGDGKIDASEMAQSPRGADLPMYDRNHDGVITLNEMEYRYARRRLDNERENRNVAGGGNDRGGRDRGDRDRGDRSRGGGPRDDGRGGSADDKDGDKDSARKTFRRKSATELLPSGLPDWFAPSDKDGDGQVALHEFADPMSDPDLAEFNQFDLNGDGLITPQECLRAKQKGAVRSGSPPAAPVAATPAPPATTAPGAAAPAPPGTTAAAPAAAASVPSATTAPAAAAPAPPGTSAPAAATPATPGTTAGPAVDPRFLAYCKKLIEKYDTNHDGELTAQEWAKMSKNPAMADTDRNGRITVEEFARWMQQQQ
jgi:Ca2+-binding EF-hand superfamily protein